MIEHGSAVISRLHLKEVLISPEYAEIIADHIRTFSTTKPEDGEIISRASLDSLGQVYGLGPGSSASFKKPFLFIDGFAIIPVHGLLLNRFPGYWGFVTGYNYIRAMMNAALADDEVETIVLDVNTPGGEAAGCPELGDEIFAARAIKPIVAMVDADAYSAGCWIATSAGRVILTPSGGTGSVGVVSMHVSLKGYYEKEGVKVTLMFAGEHKVDGNRFEDLPDDVRKEKERVLQKIYDTFVAAVARNRGLDEQVVRDTEARIFRADEALRLGFVDAIQSPAEAISSRFGETEAQDDDDDPETDDDEEASMAKLTDTTETDKGPDEATIRADAATATKTRIKAITTHTEATGRTELAEHLAFDTDLSVEQAGAILAKAPKAAAAAATPAIVEPKPGKTKTESEQEPNRFAKAMDGDEHPEMTNPEPKPGANANDEEGKRGGRLVAALAKATGIKPAEKAAAH